MATTVTMGLGLPGVPAIEAGGQTMHQGTIFPVANQSPDADGPPRRQRSPRKTRLAPVISSAQGSARILGPSSALKQNSIKDPVLHALTTDFIDKRDAFFIGNKPKLEAVSAFLTSGESDLGMGHASRLEGIRDVFTGLGYDDLAGHSETEWHRLKSQFTAFVGELSGVRGSAQRAGRQDVAELCEGLYRGARDLIASFHQVIEYLLDQKGAPTSPQIRIGEAVTGDLPAMLRKWEGNARQTSWGRSVIWNVIPAEPREASLPLTALSSLVLQWVTNALNVVDPHRKGGVEDPPILTVQAVIGAEIGRAFFLRDAVDAEKDFPGLLAEASYLFVSVVNQGEIPIERLNMLREGVHFTTSAFGNGVGTQEARAIIAALHGVPFFLSQRGSTEIGAILPIMPPQ